MKQSTRWNQVLQNEKGMALVLVLLLIMIFSVLTLSLVGVTSSNLTLSSGEKDYQSSFYIAEAGITVRMEELKDAVLNAYHSTDTAESFYSQIDNVLAIGTTVTVDDFNTSGAIANTTVSKIDTQGNTTARQYSITSEGVVDKRSRTLHSDVTINWQEEDTGSPIEWLEDMAVFTNQSITTSVTIHGSIGTNSSAENAIILDWGASVSGKAFVGPQANVERSINKPEWFAFNTEVKRLPKEVIYELPPFPEYPANFSKPANREITDSGGHNRHLVLNNGSLLITHYLANNYVFQLQENYYIPEISINSNRNLIIDVGNTDKKIVVDHLNVSNGHIQLRGEGSLTIYVNDKITMGSGSTINNNGDINDLHLYMKASENPSQPKSLTLGGAQRIYGSFYGEDTNVTLTSGGGFQGHILTGGSHVEISGGSDNTTRLFYAPNATFSMKEGGSIRGIIISNHFIATGGSQVTFEELTEDQLPPFFPPPDTGSGGGNVGIDELIINTTPTREK